MVVGIEQADGHACLDIGKANAFPVGSDKLQWAYVVSVVSLNVRGVRSLRNNNFYRMALFFVITYKFRLASTNPVVA